MAKILHISHMLGTNNVGFVNRSNSPAVSQSPLHLSAVASLMSLTTIAGIFIVTQSEVFAEKLIALSPQGVFSSMAVSVTCAGALSGASR